MAQNETVKKRIYLDHNATTPYHPELVKAWPELIKIFGNPSSIHQDSRLPKNIIRETRSKVAKLLNVSPLEIVFNSGASEGNTTVFMSILEIIKPEKNEILISAVEHPSIMSVIPALEKRGAVIKIIPVNINGELDLTFLKNNLSSRTLLVSVMLANNETGSIFPVKKIATMAHEVKAYMHSDCVQMLGKAEVNFTELNLDYATFSAHKFYSLKGTGFLYVKRNSPYSPLVFGGGQERARRGGTENTMGIAALGIVLDQLTEVKNKIELMEKLRNYMESQILNKIPYVSITAQSSNRLCNTSSIVIKSVDGESLLMSLDLLGFSVSTGAACSSGNPEPSPVLLAIGLNREQAQSSLRISLGWHTTLEQIDSFLEALSQVVARLRTIAELDT